MSDIRIILSSNSVRNTMAACDSLGIHNDISKPQDAVKVTRWDSSTNENIFVGEFKLPLFSMDLIRFGPNDEWMRVKMFLVRAGSIFSRYLILFDYYEIFSSTSSTDSFSARSFVGNNGERYRWKTAWPPQLRVCKVITSTQLSQPY
jgi:hypothetical protein